MKTVFRALGLVFCILPPALAVLDYFPLWLADGKKTASALGLLLLLLCALPLWRQIKRLLASPSVWVMWLMLWALLSLFSAIMEGLVAVSFMGFIGGVPGAIFFKLAERDRA